MGRAWPIGRAAMSCSPEVGRRMLPHGRHPGVCQEDQMSLKRRPSTSGTRSAAQDLQAVAADHDFSEERCRRPNCLTRGKSVSGHPFPRGSVTYQLETSRFLCRKRRGTPLEEKLNCMCHPRRGFSNMVLLFRKGYGYSILACSPASPTCPTSSPRPHF